MIIIRICKIHEIKVFNDSGLRFFVIHRSFCGIGRKARDFGIATLYLVSIDNAIPTGLILQREMK